MLKIENFSQTGCESLLMQDYTHLVIRYKLDRDETGGRCGVIIFEALQDDSEEKAIPIRQVMSLPEVGLTRYYVMYHS